MFSERIAPGAQRDELRRDPVHPDAQGPLDPDGDARVTRHLVHDRLQLLVIENELTLRPGQSLGQALLGDEFFGYARRRTQRGKRLSDEPNLSRQTYTEWSVTTMVFEWNDRHRPSSIGNITDSIMQPQILR